ncbi:MAG: hypothetical protein ACFNJN_07870, partial [Capnocytophaga ochracea]
MAIRELENEVRAAQAKTLAKCIPLKVTYLNYRKETEFFRRRLRGFLVKKGWCNARHCTSLYSDQ